MSNTLTSAFGLGDIGKPDGNPPESGSGPVSPHSSERSPTHGAAEKSELTRTVERAKALLCKQLFGEDSALLSVGRFTLKGTLGRGGMGVVYSAWDPLRREQVALKLLYERGPSPLYRMKREFRTLAELTHPNLVTLHELSVHEPTGEAYFTMELIAGRDFVAHVRDDAPPGSLPRDLQRLVRALAQLCRGVHALHATGKLHRDLKPSNVLVADDDGRVVLLDFGLTADVGVASSDAGTPAYMAPEQAQGRPSEPSDWYSIGLVLRDALGGEAARAPLPSGSEGEVAHTLIQLAERLTRHEPSERPGLSEILALLSALETSAPRGVPELADAPVPARAIPFVGREPELAALRAAFARSRSAPDVTLVHGASGIGKTTLLRRFIEQTLVPAGALVLRGRCYERESLPFKALDDVIDALCQHLLTLPEAEVAALCSEETAPLAKLFPVLGRVSALRGSKVACVHEAPGSARKAGVAALRKLLAGLVRRQPLVLCIDDLQWSDADSGRLLAELLTLEDAPPLLLIATDRTGTELPSPTIDALLRAGAHCPLPVTAIEIPLSGLGEGEASALARSVFPEARDDELSALVAQAQGNPMLVRELAGWASARRSVEQGSTATDLTALFGQRLSVLSEAARGVLELIAAAGCPLPLPVVEQAAALTAPVQVVLSELRAARLVHVFERRDQPLCELAHDSIGPAVVGRRSAEVQVALHARLARAFELVQGGECEALVEQYIGARMPREAAACAERAAARAYAGLAFESAARLYEVALRLGHPVRPRRAELQGAYGHALSHAGRALEAAAAYEVAATLETERFAIADLLQRAARHRMLSGQWAEGESLLERGYRLLGMRWPRHRLTLALMTGAMCLPRALWLRPRRPVPERLRRARISFLIGAGMGIEQYDPLRALHSALTCMAESDPLADVDPVLRLRALGLRGLLRCCSLRLGGSARGLKELERASLAARALGDRDAMADVDAHLAIAHYLGGKLQTSLTVAERSEAHMRAASTESSRLYALLAMINSTLVDLGRLREAERRWNAYAYELRAHGDLTAKFVDAHPIRYMMLFAREQPEQVPVTFARFSALCAQHPRYIGMHWARAMFRLECALYWGGPDEVDEILRVEHRALFVAGYPPCAQVSRRLCARARLFLSARASSVRARHALARRAVRELPRRRAKNSLQEGQARLIAASAAHLLGEAGRVRGELDAALEAFERADAKLWAASTAYCKGALSGDDRGRAAMADAAQVLRAEGITQPLRWVRWMAAGFEEVLESS